ncbi:MAG: hypothetical protein HRU40_00740 [Saprospiraceae bacterium]|nr:hypothetical protein [Saprospiraceae bacterium]
MKTKIVLWGLDAEGKRTLMALELLAAESKVNLYTFQEPVATEELSNQLMNDWRNNKELSFPDPHQKEVRSLSVSAPLLPEGFKVEREDVIQRAHTEWQFIVLSARLNQAYESELADISDRVSGLDAFDSKTWEELKSFWNKVQAQVRERNLFKDHADTLRDRTNELFSRMKSMRSKLDEEFKKRSAETQKEFQEKLQDIEDRLGKGLRLQTLFDELKQIQRKFRESKFTRDDRAKVWNRLDAAFKQVKEKRFGPDAAGDKSPFERLQRRYNGLLEAIKKMERSIKRDEDELSFQQRKIERTDGQLEAQIREAKIKMIQDRIDSKKEKFADMVKTRQELEKRLEKEKAKEEKRKAEALAKEKAKEEIAKKIQEQNEALEDKADELEKAARQLKEGKKDVGPSTKKSTNDDDQASSGDSGESIVKAVGSMLGEALEDVVDTVKAVAVVIGDQVDSGTDEPVDESSPQKEEEE